MSERENKKKKNGCWNGRCVEDHPLRGNSEQQASKRTDCSPTPTHCFQHLGPFHASSRQPIFISSWYVFVAFWLLTYFRSRRLSFLFLEACLAPAETECMTALVHCSFPAHAWAPILQCLVPFLECMKDGKLSYSTPSKSLSSRILCMAPGRLMPTISFRKQTNVCSRTFHWESTNEC